MEVSRILFISICLTCELEDVFYNVRGATRNWNYETRTSEREFEACASALRSTVRRASLQLTRSRDCAQRRTANVKGWNAVSGAHGVSIPAWLSSIVFVKFHSIESKL